MGLFDKFFGGLGKTRQNIDLEELFQGYAPDSEEFYENLEEMLILADAGMPVAERVDYLMRRKTWEDRYRKGDEAREGLIKILDGLLDVGSPALKLDTRPSVILMVGVNGVGKTTTIGKLAHQLVQDGKKVMLCAGDTFRAAAAEQLGIWAERAGCDFVADKVCVKPELADIVITTNGGYPLDQNAYQSPKGMTAAEATVKENGVIIMLATCSDGTGGDFFYHIIADEPDIETAYQKFLATPQEKTAPDQWCSQILARIRRKHPIIFVAQTEQKEMIEGLKMEYAPDLASAYKRAREIKGENATLTCIPNGISVVVK